jgi:hypothetical protein
MNKRIISFVLSLFFLSILTYEYVSSVILLEGSSLKTSEFVIEKRLVNDTADDKLFIPVVPVTFYAIIQTATPQFISKLYSFKFLSTIFKPPIIS